MKLTVMAADERIFFVDVEPGESIENVKAILEVETQVPVSSQLLLYNGQNLPNSGKLDAFGVKDNDLLLMHVRSAPAAPSAPPVAPSGPFGASDADLAQLSDGSAVNPEAFRRRLMNDAASMSRIMSANPALAQIIAGGDLEALQKMLRALRKAALDAQKEEREQMELLTSDPFDVEAQRRIEAAIRQKAIDENYETAYEHSPEQFVAVHMLYVEMEVNNHPIKAFVDSGAQNTIMSKACAERCGLTRLLDTRYEGIARGVGTTKIVGRIHAVQLKIGHNFYVCSISVLDADNMDFLFGLDMLRRHQCCIDLKDNVLRVGAGEISVPFLAEKDIPSWLNKLDGEGSSLGAAAQPQEASTATTSGARPSGEALQSRPAPSVEAGAAAEGREVAAAAAAAATTTAGAVGGRGTTAAASGGTGALPTALPQASAAFPEAKIKSLTDLGFDRTSVLHALQITNGNEEQAAAILFGG